MRLGNRTSPRSADASKAACFRAASPDAPGDHRVQDDSRPQKGAIALRDLVPLTLGEQAPEIRSTRPPSRRTRRAHDPTKQHSRPRADTRRKELAHEISVRKQDRHIMVLPAPLGDEEHRQHDQGDFAEQPRIAPVRRLGPAEDRQQRHQAEARPP